MTAQCEFLLLSKPTIHNTQIILGSFVTHTQQLNSVTYYGPFLIDKTCYQTACYLSSNKNTFLMSSSLHVKLLLFVQRTQIRNIRWR